LGTFSLLHIHLALGSSVAGENGAALQSCSDQYVAVGEASTHAGGEEGCKADGRAWRWGCRRNSCFLSVCIKSVRT